MSESRVAMNMIMIKILCCNRRMISNPVYIQNSEELIPNVCSYGTNAARIELWDSYF